MVDIIDFHKAPEWHSVFYGDPKPEDIKRLKDYLQKNKDKKVRLYHGTSAEYPILKEGLKPTTKTRRNSYQSSSGYVYLSVFPGMAKTFGEGAFPKKKVVVYQVDVPIHELKADLDQLANKRYWANEKIGNSLAESFAYGYGARVRGKIVAEKIALFQQNTD